MADENDLPSDSEPQEKEPAEGQQATDLPQEVTNAQVEVSRDTSDPKYVKRRKREVKDKAALEQADLLWVMGDYRGRAFVWRQLAACDIYTAGFPDNDRLLNFDQGRRTIGLNLQQQLIEANPVLFNQMRDEAIERDKREAEL